MLARGEEGGRATVCNARLARCFRAISYELGTSLELARFMRDLRPHTLNITLVLQD